MFSEPFDLTRSSKGGKSGVTPLKICLWRIAAMFLKISTSVFFAMFLTLAQLTVMLYKGGKSRVTPPENRFLHNCSHVLEDIDFLSFQL